MLDSHNIHIQYFPQSHLDSALSALKQQNKTALLLLEHTKLSKTALTTAEFQPLIHLKSGLESIGSSNSQNEPWCELWSAAGQWEHGSQSNQSNSGRLSFCTNNEYLIGSLSIPLTAQDSLQQQTQSYYEQIIDFINAQEKPHLLRMWNYFPFINQLDEGFERYQQFCVGRHHAFNDHQNSANTKIQYPAASALGSHSSMMLILFIATKQPVLFIENPDQISAYAYPSHYSPRSPSFSRASVHQTSLNKQLYISGTASIVGHKSLFPGDISGQTKQTIKNIKKLIQHAGKKFNVSTHSKTYDNATDLSSLKVYLRNPHDFPKVAPLVQEFVPLCNNICYLQADICRQELDIEIEMLLNSKNAH